MYSTKINVTANGNYPDADGEALHASLWTPLVIHPSHGADVRVEYSRDGQSWESSKGMNVERDRPFKRSMRPATGDAPRRFRVVVANFQSNFLIEVGPTTSNPYPV